MYSQLKLFLPTLAPFLSHIFQFVVAYVLHGEREYVSILVNTVMYLQCKSVKTYS